MPQYITYDQLKKIFPPSLCIECCQMISISAWAEGVEIECRKIQGGHEPLKSCKYYVNKEDEDRRMADDLRVAGYDIIVERIKTSNGKTVAQYRMG